MAISEKDRHACIRMAIFFGINVYLSCSQHLFPLGPAGELTNQLELLLVRSGRKNIITPALACA